MSHFSRMIKSGEVALRKDGTFYSGDTGGADAGASNQNFAMPSAPAHMHMIADHHQNESELHSGIASRLQQVGMDKSAANHRAVANEHAAAASHYRAAGDAAQDTSAKDDVAKHLKAARGCAQCAQDKTATMAG